MTSIRHRRATLVAALALALITSPAAAAEPSRETVHLSRDIPTWATCDSFAVRGRFHLVREITTFVDRTGAPVRSSVHVTITGTVSNPNRGISLDVSGVRIFHSDLTTGDTVTTGTNTIVRTLGGGVITLGTGRLEFDARGVLVGYHGPTTDEDWAALCAALA